MDKATSRKLPRPRAVDRVYESLRGDILTGALLPGARITEEDLAERFDASRTPVRSAMMRLASEGFVNMTPRSGTTVRQRSATDIAEIYNVRALLESAAAGLAATRRTTADLEVLQDLHDQMRQGVRTDGPIPAAGIERLSLLNKAFHQRILDAAGNATLADSAARLMDIGFLISTYVSFSPDDLRRSVSEHEKLVAAIHSGDADWAEALMRAHVLATRNALNRNAGRHAGGPKGAANSRPARSKRKSSQTLPGADDR